ncbi:hypothetical protein, partial [Marinithermofilum abyssi]|uniref:hypothetical protein n=1 Tax=Marinithermofilum abyssi TaxID=1571185 RepID=UPI001E497DAC
YKLHISLAVGIGLKHGIRPLLKSFLLLQQKEAADLLPLSAASPYPLRGLFCIPLLTGEISCDSIMNEHSLSSDDDITGLGLNHGKVKGGVFCTAVRSIRRNG